LTKYYSQNDEAKFILDFFPVEFKGRLVEIGAYNPEIFSNSRNLIEMGWGAILVEPSKQCYEVIEKFYIGNENVEVINAAIGPNNGELDFWDSAGACATGNNLHYERWKNNTNDYVKIKVPMIDWKTFTRLYGNKFDFISIDTEGMDYEILKQINLFDSGVQLICIEYTYNSQEIYDYIKSYGFDLLLQNGENIIMSRNIL